MMRVGRVGVGRRCWEGVLAQSCLGFVVVIVVVDVGGSV